MNTNFKDQVTKQIEDKYKEYETLVRDLADKQIDIKEKISEINSLIEHVNIRINYAEMRITRTVTFSFAIIGFGMAFFTVVLQLSGLTFYLGLATSFSLIITGVIASLTHALQINPKYPFRAISTDWKWFYLGIIDQNYRPTAFVRESEEKYLKKRLLHFVGLQEYAKGLLNEDNTERLRVDIQQLFLLHANEKYKNCFLSTLRSILKWGLAVTFVLFLALSIALAAKKIFNRDSASRLIENHQSIHSPIEPTPDLRMGIPKGQASLVLSLLSPDA